MLRSTCGSDRDFACRYRVVLSAMRRSFSLLRKPLPNPSSQQPMTIDPSVVDHGLAIDGASNFVGELELICGEIEVFAAWQDVPAMSFDWGSVSKYGSDQQCSPEVVLDDSSCDSALSARRIARRPLGRVIAGVRCPTGPEGRFEDTHVDTHHRHRTRPANAIPWRRRWAEACGSSGNRGRIIERRYRAVRMTVQSLRRAPRSGTLGGCRTRV